MAKCDICGVHALGSELAHLRDCYQVEGVKDMCPKCEKWANDELWRIRATNAPEMQRRLRERMALPPQKKTFWQRLFGLPKPRTPAWGEY
jgi:hypothetical protein